MNKRFLIAVVVLGMLAALALWVLVVALFITPQYKAANDAGLEPAAETILILQGLMSCVVGHLCGKLGTKAIDAINKRY